jgi:hypothetical protein
LKSEGSQSIFAQDSASIGEQSGILVVSPATHLVISGLPKTIKAGMPFTITVQAFDAAGRPDPLFQDAIHFSSSDPLAVLPGDYAFQPADNGQQSFTIILKSPGTRKIIVTDLVRPALKVVLLSPCNQAPGIVRLAAGVSVHVAVQDLWAVMRLGRMTGAISR